MGEGTVYEDPAFEEDDEDVDDEIFDHTHVISEESIRSYISNLISFDPNDHPSVLRTDRHTVLLENHKEFLACLNRLTSAYRKMRILPLKKPMLTSLKYYEVSYRKCENYYLVHPSRNHHANDSIVCTKGMLGLIDRKNNTSGGRTWTKTRIYSLEEYEEVEVYSRDMVGTTTRR